MQVLDNTTASRVHTVPMGTMSKLTNPNHIPAPDLMAIIERTAPSWDGVSILYTLSGSLDVRIAKLAAMVTNKMAALVRTGEPDFYGVMPPTVDSFNNAMAALAEAETSAWAFEFFGMDNKDMAADLTTLLGFRLTVINRISAITKYPPESRWIEAITLAATPMPVAEWKLEMGWEEYVAECNGKPEMTEEEHRELETKQLAGKAELWPAYAAQIVATIDMASPAELEFDELNPLIQLRLMEALSTPEREAKLRLNAKKRARDQADLHARRANISSCLAEIRLACTHARYASIIAQRTI